MKKKVALLGWNSKEEVRMGKETRAEKEKDDQDFPFFFPSCEALL